MPRRVLGYARVSSEEQSLGTSLRDQQDSIRAHAKTCGLTVTKFFVEAVSGIREKEEHREQMKLLLAEVRDGDLVLVDKLDRWSRDAEFSYSSVRRILAAGASFYAVSDRVDPSTSEGDTALSFRILFAREEHKRIKQRMVGTRYILRNQGYYAEGLPPLGYRRSAPPGTRGAEKNALEIIPEEAELVRAIFRHYIGGDSMQQVATRLGLKLDRVKDALDRRFYIGELQRPPSRAGARDGEWFKGQHEPIIDTTTWLRARAIVEQRRRGGPRNGDFVTNDWIIRDRARCAACGAKMTSAYGPVRGDGVQHYYYRCSHKCPPGKRMIRVRLVEEQFVPMVLERLTELRTELATGREPTKVKVDTKAARLKLQKRRDKYLEAFADDLMSREELKAVMARVDQERLKLDAKETAAHDPLGDTKVRRELLGQVSVLRQAWKSATPAEQRVIVNRLTVSIGINHGVDPKPKWVPVSDLVK